MVQCQWCGSYRGVGRVRVNGQDSRVPLHLCYTCFGVYAETGQRPNMPRGPLSLPNAVGSVPFTADLIRRLR